MRFDILLNQFDDRISDYSSMARHSTIEYRTFQTIEFSGSITLLDSGDTPTPSPEVFFVYTD